MHSDRFGAAFDQVPGSRYLVVWSVRRDPEGKHRLAGIHGATGAWCCDEIMVLNNMEYETIKWVRAKCLEDACRVYQGESSRNSAPRLVHFHPWR